MMHIGSEKRIFRTIILYVIIVMIAIFSNCTKTSEKSLISKPPDKKPAAVIVPKIGIQMLKSDTLSAKQVKKITLKIYHRLISIKGIKYIAFKEHDKSSLAVNHQLTGTVNRLDAGYSLKVRITSDLNGENVYNRASVVSEEIELDYLINDIAERVVEKLW